MSTFLSYCCLPGPPDPVICINTVTLFPIAALMSQHTSSSSQTISSQSLDRGDRDYTMPAGFATAAVQAAIAVVKQFRKGEISKTEAILDIQAALTSGEDEPSNEELVSALSSYITILDNIQESSGENQPRGAASSTRVALNQKPLSNTLLHCPLLPPISQSQTLMSSSFLPQATQQTRGDSIKSTQKERSQKRG